MMRLFFLKIGPGLLAVGLLFSSFSPIRPALKMFEASARVLAGEQQVDTSDVALGGSRARPAPRYGRPPLRGLRQPQPPPPEGFDLVAFFKSLGGDQSGRTKEKLTALARDAKRRRTFAGE